MLERAGPCPGLSSLAHSFLGSPSGPTQLSKLELTDGNEAPVRDLIKPRPDAGRASSVVRALI
jgi:hypothetical protein